MLTDAPKSTEPSGGLALLINRGALAIALVGIMNVGIVVWFLVRTEAHDTTIALVHRQQTVAFQVMGLAADGDVAEPGALDAARRELAATMTLLRRGGLDRGVEVPPAPSFVSPEIDRLEAGYDALEGELAGARRTARIRELAEGISLDADDVETRLRRSRETYRNALSVLALVTSAFLLTISLVGVRFVQAKVLNPVRGLQALARRALERKTPPEMDVPAEPELEQAVEAVVNLSERLEEVRVERDVAQADFETIFDNSLAGIYRVDEQGRVLLANRALAKVLSYEDPGALQRAVENAHHQLFVEPSHRARFVKSAAPRALPIIETRLRRRDGAEIWVLESARTFDDGQHHGCEGVVFDITPRKKAFDALRRLTGRLMEVRDDERRRLARELHDSMGQLLAAMKMNMTRLDEEADLSPASTALLEDSLSLCDEASRQTRTMSHLLHPPLLEELGLEHAIRDYAEGFQKRSDIVVDVEIDVPERLPSLVELSAFRFVQECLTNVHRHSGSERARIHLSCRDDSVRVRVEDDGRGLPEDMRQADGSLDSLGVGLGGLSARVEQIGGRLEIESSSAGTTVTAIVPLEQPERAS